jgi:hypothetical protein
MTSQVVVGLFYTSGTAEDVRNRLKFQGLPAGDIAVRQVRSNDPLPPAMAAAARGYAGDPFFGSIILKKFGDRIGDGETAVIVAAQSDDEVRIAIATMRLYTPVAVELLEPAEVDTLLRKEPAKPAP